MLSHGSYLSWQASPFPQLHHPEKRRQSLQILPSHSSRCENIMNVIQLDNVPLSVLRTSIIQRSLELYQGNIISIF